MIGRPITVHSRLLNIVFSLLVVQMILIAMINAQTAVTQFAKVLRLMLSISLSLWVVFQRAFGATLAFAQAFVFQT